MTSCNSCRLIAFPNDLRARVARLRFHCLPSRSSMEICSNVRTGEVGAVEASSVMAPSL